MDGYFVKAIIASLKTIRSNWSSLLVLWFIRKKDDSKLTRCNNLFFFLDELNSILLTQLVTSNLRSHILGYDGLCFNNIILKGIEMSRRDLAKLRDMACKFVSRVMAQP